MLNRGLTARLVLYGGLVPILDRSSLRWHRDRAAITLPAAAGHYALCLFPAEEVGALAIEGIDPARPRPGISCAEGWLSPRGALTLAPALP